MIKQKYFLKMFIYISSLVFIFAIITAIIFFSKMNKIDKTQKENLNNQFIMQTSQNTDYILKSSWNLRNSLRLNDDVSKYTQNIDYYYSVTQIYKELQKSQSSFSNLHYDVGITKENDNIIITPSSTLDKEIYYDYLGLNENQLTELNDFLSNQSRRNPLLLKSNLNNSKSVYIMVSKERITSDRQIYIFMIYYAEHFFPYEHLSNNIIAIYDGNNILYHYKNESSFKNFTERFSKDELKYALDSNINANSFVLGNSNYVLYPKKSEIQNWSYILIKNIENNKTTISKLLGYYLFVWILLILSGIILSFFIAKKTYKPIDNLVKQFRNSKDDIMIDEISFINDTIKRIQKTNIRMLEIIENNKAPLKTLFLRKASLGLISNEEINKGLTKYHLNIYKQKWIPCVISIIESDENNNISKDASVMIKSQIVDFFKKQLSAKMYNEIFDLDYSKSILIINESNLENVINTLKKVLAIIEVNFKIKLTISIGTPVDNLTDVSPSLSKAIALLSENGMFDNKMILNCNEEINESQSQNYYYPISYEVDLINFTIHGNKEEVLKIINNIIDENHKKRHLSKKSQNNLILALAGTIHRILNQNVKSTKLVFDNDFNIFLELKTQTTLENLKRKLSDIFSAIVDNINQQSKEEYLDLADKMIDYVHLNYMKDIYLIDIAQHFNLSVGYIGKAFKTHTGENFKDFLNRYRVEKAIAILRDDSEIKIKELSWMVGCNHPNTFIRMFKKHTGFSPGQYKKSI